MPRPIMIIVTVLGQGERGIERLYVSFRVEITIVEPRVQVVVARSARDHFCVHLVPISWTASQPTLSPAGRALSVMSLRTRGCGR